MYKSTKSTMAATRAAAVMRLMNQARTTFAGCQCHGCSSSASTTHSHFDIANAAKSIASRGKSKTWVRQDRGYATPIDSHPAEDREYAFEVAASNLRFGEGVTREIGMDFKNMGARKVGVYTDPTVAKLRPMTTSIESLEENGIPYEIFSSCAVEPTQASWQAAIDFARQHDFSHFLAVGGGSSIDTCKIANLFSCYPEAELLDFVNAPIGKGLPVDKSLKPLIAVPTTAGTGSETTGTAIFDYTPLMAKTGIASRAMRPTLGIVDPLNTESCPVAVHISSGLDVLFHALESYTAIPYNERVPRPKNPINRPAYQGSNPISDVFSLWALEQTVKNLPRVARDPMDKEARETMLLASTFAGIGFGNAGVHLCHGFSYPISGLNKKIAKYRHTGYEVDHPIVPHGISVALTGPSVFSYTAPSSPSRHRDAARVFERYAKLQGVDDGTDADKVSDDAVGQLLHDRIARFLVALGVPRGLSSIGYARGDVGELVKGTLPQRRVLDLAPGDTGEADLARMLERAMTF